ncbi:sensor histidine kinase [Paenibacillus harenae]|uniref:Two-component system sensor histidine kinase YesM n=1 Tax=Paenibacillus harenae TaxID=306543 RepID=A0ABT9TV01_PAEHA|nr:sensor histidine kinase [Paenibacillus harenae]MDQ0111195.1 two-component system sensor histidine kinase YesM [Paenibacillus harenae]
MRTGLNNPMTKMNVKQQLILLFLVMVSPIFLLHWYGNIKTEHLLKNHVTNAYVELIKQNYTLINRDIDTVSKITTTMIQNPVVQKLVPSEQDTVIERVRKFDSVDKLLSNNSIPLNGGEAVYYSLYVYDPNDYYFFAPKRQINQTGVYFFNDATKPSWFDDAVKRNSGAYMAMIDTNVGLSRVKTYAYIRAVNNVTIANDTIGILVATQMDKKIGESLRSVSLPDGNIYFTDWNDRVMSATDPSLIDTVLSLPPEAAIPDNVNSQGNLDLITDDSIYVVNYDRSSQTKLIYQIPVESLLKQQNELKRVIQLISVAYLLLGCIVMIYFWRSLMTPLQRLAQFVRAYEPGKLVPETPFKGRNDEVGVLVGALYDMARRLNVLIHYKYNMDLKQKESQLQLLYQQINPHLLYNTLESIYWKSSLEGKTESADMIKELSKLMKISLSRGRELITLEEELEHASAYVSLQQKRYKYEFEVNWVIPDAARLILIPKITLQPLIENAMIHAVKNMGEDGEIRISAMVEGERVTIKVEDNGHKAVDYAALDRLLSGDKPDHASGYGIRNIQQRIKLHFGNQYGLGYKEREHGGTSATIILPMITEEQQKRDV